MNFRFVLLAVVIALFEAVSAQDAYAQRVFAATNQYRYDKGKKGPLCFNAKLQVAAQRVADENAECEQLGHDTCKYLRNGKKSNMVGRVNEAGYKWKSLSENVATHSLSLADIEEVVKRWAASPGHNANMLGDNPQTGMAYACSKKRCYISQVFGNSAKETCLSPKRPTPVTNRPFQSFNVRTNKLRNNIKATVQHYQGSVCDGYASSPQGRHQLGGISSLDSFDNYMNYKQWMEDPDYVRMLHRCYQDYNCAGVNFGKDGFSYRRSNVIVKSPDPYEWCQIITDISTA